MAITNRQSGTNVHEIADRIFRINTPVEIECAGGFSFNQYLAAANPETLACMHGSAWHGDGARLLRALADELAS